MNFVDPNKPIEEQRREYLRHTELLQSLMNNEGWKMMEAYLKVEEERIFESLAKAQTADAALIAEQAYVTIRNIRDWPHTQFKHAVEGVKQLSPAVTPRK